MLTPQCARRSAALAGLALATGLAAGSAVAAKTIPAAFQGTWVKTASACASGPALTIEATRVSFMNGAQSQRFTRFEVVSSGGGRAAPGALEVLADGPDGSPFLIFLTPGKPPKVNLNWRPMEDQLARRYPLAPQALTRCSG